MKDSKKTKDKRDFKKREQKSKTTNDVSWYSHVPGLMNAAANISYASILGLPVAFGDDQRQSANIVIPGIMRLGLIPGVGVSKNAASDVNAASRLLYSFVRHANSGSRNYESPDLFMYILAMNQVYAYISELKRLYGLAMEYSVTNRYISKALIEALGYDSDDIVNHLADLRYYVEYFSLRASSMAVPSSMDLYKRSVWLHGPVFADATDNKAQLYVLQYSEFLVFNGRASDTGSILIPYLYSKEPGSSGRSFAYIKSFGDRLLEPLLADEDLGIMSGDILKAFGDGGIYKLTPLDPNYRTPIVYDENVLAQIHNARVLNCEEPDFSTNTNPLCITQSNGSIIYDPVFTIGMYTDGAPSTLPIEEIFKAYLLQDNILDSGMSNPTPEFNMEATRLKCALEYHDPSSQEVTDHKLYVRLANSGTEVVSTATMYFINHTSGQGSGPSFLNAVQIKDLTPANVYAPTLYDFLKDVVSPFIYKQYFDWAPLTMAVFKLGDNAEYKYYPIGEIFNYTPLGEATLGKLHNVAITSLLNIPTIGFMR